MRPILLIITILSMLSGSAQARDVCQVDQGCPTPEVVPQCTADQAKRAAIAAKRAADAPMPAAGERIDLVGTSSVRAMCTERGCLFETRCCNGCSGSVRIELATALKGQRFLPLHDEKPTRFQVTGDESLTCNPLDIEDGTRVFVSGAFEFPRRVIMEVPYEDGKPGTPIERDLGIDTARPYLDHVVMCRL